MISSAIMVQMNGLRSAVKCFRPVADRGDENAGEHTAWSRRSVRALYRTHRTADDTRHAGLRALGNRVVGILHGCFKRHAPDDETIAWQHRPGQKPPQVA